MYIYIKSILNQIRKISSIEYHGGFKKREKGGASESRRRGLKSCEKIQSFFFFLSPLPFFHRAHFLPELPRHPRSSTQRYRIRNRNLELWKKMLSI